MLFDHGQPPKVLEEEEIKPVSELDENSKTERKHVELNTTTSKEVRKEN